MKTPGLWKGKPAQGVMPAMGVKLEIEEIERSETGENAATPGCLMYVGSFRVVEPSEYKGHGLREWFTIGTKEDKRAKKEETWNRPEQGPGRLLLLLEKAQVPNSDDDEEWMEAAAGCFVYAHVTQRDENGEPRNRIGKYFEEGDEDFIGVGEELENRSSRAGGRSGKKKPKRDDDEEKSPRGGKKKGDDDDEERDEDTEDEGDEEESKSARGKKSSKKDDDDEDEDRPRKRAAKGKGRRDDDED